VPAGPSCSRPRWPSWCRPSPCASGARPWPFLRHRRRPHRHRPDPRGLSHRVDLAGHLLGQHPRGHHRPGPDRHLQADDGAPAGSHRLPGPGPDRRRGGAERVRFPAVVGLGLEQSRPSDCASPPAWCSSSSSVLRRGPHPSPLMQMSIFRIRAFLVENLVLGIAMLVFIPVFFFASEYAQIALGKTASQAGLFLLYFFIGFVVAAQIGGRMLDRRGAKRPVVVGCALAAVGFYLWAGKVTQLTSAPSSGTSSWPGPAWGSCSARPAPTPSTGRPALLRRGHRHHPDGPELRRQPGARHPRHHPGLADALPDHHVAGRPGRPTRPAAARRRSLSQSQGGSGSTRPSRISSGSTSPTPPAPSST
jgi:hypothetical protein